MDRPGHEHCEAVIESLQRQLADALERTFVALGRAGANADLAHAFRAEWEQARATLRAAGRIP